MDGQRSPRSSWSEHPLRRLQSIRRDGHAQLVGHLLVDDQLGAGYEHAQAPGLLSARDPVDELSGALPDGGELGRVTKKWGGLGKELLTSADNYIIALAEDRQLPRNTAMLLLAAGLAIDIVYKEK